VRGSNDCGGVVNRKVGRSKYGGVYSCSCLSHVMTDRGCSQEAEGIITHLLPYPMSYASNALISCIKFWTCCRRVFKADSLQEVYVMTHAMNCNLGAGRNVSGRGVMLCESLVIAKSEVPVNRDRRQHGQCIAWLFKVMTLMGNPVRHFDQ
jgi:hypothetical protein